MQECYCFPFFNRKISYLNISLSSCFKENISLCIIIGFSNIHKSLGNHTVWVPIKKMWKNKWPKSKKYLLPSCCLLFSLSTTCDRIQIQVRLCLLWILHCGASGMPRASVTWPSCRFLTSWASQRLVVVSSFSTWAKVLSFSWSGRHWRSASLALRKEQHKTSF